MNWSTLKAAISSVIKANGNQAITGDVLRNTLNSMVTSLGENYQFAGIASPSTNPGSPDGNICYLAGSGLYVNFSNIVIDDGQIGMLLWDGNWHKQIINIGTSGGGGGGEGGSVDKITFDDIDAIF